MQKTFSRKMGPTRTFYDRQFLSYLKKTAEKLIFLPVSMVFLCFKGLFIVKMTFPQFQKDLKDAESIFEKEGTNQNVLRSTVLKLQPKKQKVCHNFSITVAVAVSLFQFLLRMVKEMILMFGLRAIQMQNFKENPMVKSVWLYLVQGGRKFYSSGVRP